MLMMVLLLPGGLLGGYGGVPDGVNGSPACLFPSACALGLSHGFRVRGLQQAPKKNNNCFCSNLTLAIASLLQQALAMPPSRLSQPVASPGKSS